MRRLNSLTCLYALLFAVCTNSAQPANAQTPLPIELREKIDQLVTESLNKSGVPSASVAIVKDGRIAYVKAYGSARLEPKTAASADMRYSIGSISKQFTAAGLLLLQERGKLSLDDKVAKFIPDLTRANEVTIRQLLSHTSGYQDYWPQDYVMPMMLQPVTARKILDTWARKPLDFEPGTKWQYSNTNYVIAGLILEKASGKPFWRFLQENIFQPLKMKNVADIDREKLGELDAAGYKRYALGPLRRAPKEGAGWLFATGELAMPASDLAKWNLALIEQKLLKPESHRELATEVLLKNGLGTRYGLGVSLLTEAGHRVVSHGGEVSGFTAQNAVLPDERVAITVLTNQDAVGTSGAIARLVAPLLLAGNNADISRKQDQARVIFEKLQRGEIDRSLFTDNANFYFSSEALQDIASGLAPLGAPQEFVQINQALRGGMTLRVYRVRLGEKTLRAWTYEMPDGKLEQYQIAEQN